MKGSWREEPLSARYPKVAGAGQFLSPLGCIYIYIYEGVLTRTDEYGAAKCS